MSKRLTVLQQQQSSEWMRYTHHVWRKKEGSSYKSPLTVFRQTSFYSRWRKDAEGLWGVTYFCYRSGGWLLCWPRQVVAFSIPSKAVPLLNACCFFSHGHTCFGERTTILFLEPFSTSSRKINSGLRGKSHMEVNWTPVLGTAEEGGLQT